MTQWIRVDRVEFYRTPFCNIRNIYACQVTATLECITINRSNAVGNGNACQSAATVECRISDCNNAFMNSDTF